MKVSKARVALFNCLLRIERDGSYSSELLNNLPETLAKQDRAFVRQSLLGILRQRPAIDAVIGKFSRKKIAKLDAEVVAALRIGVYQLFELVSVPDYSAVNESVELVRLARKKSAAGFVNAILRKSSKLQKDGTTLDPKALCSGILYERWSNVYGADPAESIVYANAEKPPAFFRFTPRFAALTEQEQASVSFEIGAVTESGTVEGCFRAESGSKGLVSLHRDGLVYIQDESSQLVGRVVLGLGKETFWDACAAPGGKASLAATGFERTVSTELHPKRAELLKRLAERQGVRIEVIAADAARPPFSEDAGFSVVLVDAPCSGTGTIRSNPEIRYRFREADLKQLHAKQLELLKSASNHVEKRGFLVYSSCSLEPEEGENVREAFLRSEKDFAPYLIGPDSGSEESERRILPTKNGGEGFYIACFRRN